LPPFALGFFRAAVGDLLVARLDCLYRNGDGFRWSTGLRHGADERGNTHASASRNAAFKAR
jgi:hypothetical protein